MHLQLNKFYRSPLQFDLHEQQSFWHFFRFDEQGRVSLITHEGSRPELFERWRNGVRVQHGTYSSEGATFHGAMENGVKLQGEVLDERRIRLLIEDGTGYFDAEGIYEVVMESDSIEKTQI